MSFAATPAARPWPSLPPEGELPGGTASGSMLHEILEFIPFDSLIQTPIFDDWRQRKEIDDVVTAAMNRNGIDMKHRREAETMVYHALTDEIPLGQEPSIPGLCHCRNFSARWSFSSRFRRTATRRSRQLRPGKLVIERGFIKGYVDLVVEHKDRVYFADWKSDLLPSYDSETITRARRHAL